MAYPTFTDFSPQETCALALRVEPGLFGNLAHIPHDSDQPDVEGYSSSALRC